MIEKYLEMEAMKYYDRPDDSALSDNLLQKKYTMIRNTNHEYMATQKWDGYWMMFVKGETNEEIYIRGRNRNKAGEYENYAPKVPHLVEEMKQWPNNTIVLGEICWPELSKVATDVGVILRCLAPKAIDRQKNKKLIVKLFDLLACNGNEYGDKGYQIRYSNLEDFCHAFDFKYFDISEVCYDEDLLYFADRIIAAGGEGCVIQHKDHPYEPGKRSAWKTLKLKQKLPVTTYPVVAFLEPKKEYEGKCEEVWDYWEYSDPDTNTSTILTNRPVEINENYSPVTKPFALGWKIGVTIALPNGKTCDVSSGLKDVDREWCTTDEAQNLLKAGKLYVNISAMQEATLGGLRHPVFKGWEFDKDIDR